MDVISLIISVILLLAVITYFYLFASNNKLTRSIIMYFISIALIMLTGIIYAAKTAYYPMQTDYLVHYMLYFLRIPFSYISQIFQLSLALYMFCAVLFIRNLFPVKRIITVLLIVPIIYFVVSTDPFTTKMVYLATFSKNISTAKMASNIAKATNFFGVLILYSYMILPVVMAVICYFNTNIYVKKRDTAILGVCITLINVFTYTVIINGIFKSIMFNNVNAAKVPVQIVQRNEYTFMPVLFCVVLIIIMSMIIYFKPFNYFSKARSNDLANTQKSMKDLRMQLHVYKNAFLGMKQQFALANINLANRNTDKALHNLEIGEQVANEYISNINSVLMHTGEPKLAFFENVNIVDCIDEAVKRNVLDSDIKVNINKKYSNLPIYADQKHITEVFTNLLINAVDAIKLKKCENPQIDIIIDTDGELVVVEIKDNGIGIERKNLKKIFYPFFTTKSSTYGGVGLNYAEKIIKYHNGDIRAKSVYGEYTTFQITLPIYKGDRRKCKKK